MEKTRKAAVAGKFYEDDFGFLQAQLEDCFTGPKGVGEHPIMKNSERFVGGISPHAGYVFSGQAASHLYDKLARSDVDVLVVIGPNHYGLGGNLVTTRNTSWEIPFGCVDVDNVFIDDLMARNPNVVDDLDAHVKEHSIEVQLPFIRYTKKTAKIVPLMVKDLSLEECQRLANDILEIGIEKDKKVAIIASSDFTHYGNDYGYVPFRYNIQDEIKKMDGKFIDLIRALAVKSFFKQSEQSSICGRIPITVLMEFAKLKGVEDIKVEQYYTSEDIYPCKDKNDFHSVSYASLVFE